MFVSLVQCHYYLDVQVEFQNGTYWTLGGMCYLYNADHSKLIQTKQLGSAGFVNFVDQNDQFHIEEEFQFDLYNLEDNSYVWGMSQMQHYNGYNLYTMKVWDQVLKVYCKEGEVAVPNLLVSIEYVSNNVLKNYTVQSDSDGVANFYLKNKNFTDRDPSKMYIVDPNSHYLAQTAMFLIQQTGVMSYTVYVSANPWYTKSIIIGCVIGGAVFITLLVVLIISYIKRKRVLRSDQIAMVSAVQQTTEILPTGDALPHVPNAVQIQFLGQEQVIAENQVDILAKEISSKDKTELNDQMQVQENVLQEQK